VRGIIESLDHAVVPFGRDGKAGRRPHRTLFVVCR
jgi:hypothetical protein